MIPSLHLLKESVFLFGCSATGVDGCQQNSTEATAASYPSGQAGSLQKEVFSAMGYQNRDLSQHERGGGGSRVDKTPLSPGRRLGPLPCHWASPLSPLSVPRPHSPSLPAPSISGQVSAEFSHSCHSLSWVIFSCEESVFFASLRGSQGQRLTVLPPPPAAPWVESLVYCVTSPLISLGLSFLGNLDKMPSRVSFHPADLGFYVEQLGILHQPFL